MAAFITPASRTRRVSALVSMPWAREYRVFFFQKVSSSPHSENSRAPDTSPDNIAAKRRRFAFKIRRDDSHVADQRKGLQHDLAVIAGIGQCLDIPLSSLS